MNGSALRHFSSSAGRHFSEAALFLLRVVSIGFVATAVILMKGVKPSKLKIDAVRLALLNEMRKAGTAVRRDYERTTRTWKGEKPEFAQAVSLAGGGPQLLIVVQGPGAKKWFWLDKGTKVRYATMSADFKSKTVPRVLDSRAGKGRRLFVNKKRPRPGIEARMWTELIAKKWRRPFKQRMESAMVSGAKKSGHYLRR